MNPELTPKQEAFARAYVETGNASEAYRRAYSTSKMTAKTITEAASRLLKDCKVTARIEELQAAAQERHEITVDDLLDELEEAREIAKAEGQAGYRLQPGCSGEWP